MSQHESSGGAPTLPFLPLRVQAVLPGSVVPIPIGRARSRALARALKPGDRFVLGVQYDAEIENPAIADVHPIAVLAELKDKSERGNRGVILATQALERVRLTALKVAVSGQTASDMTGSESSSSYWEARYEPVSETNAESAESKALADSLRRFVGELADESGVHATLERTKHPGQLADRVAGLIELSPDSRTEVLLSLDVEARLRLVTKLLREARTHAELRQKIDSEVRQGMTESQREAVLRQQLRAIQKELGDGDSDETERLRKRLDEADLPEDVRKTADRELERLSTMQAGHAEAHVIRTYLEWIADLPWNGRATPNLELDAMAKTLDADHHGLEEVKRRILEHMAVLKLSQKHQGTILALVGPPGVGKTSLAQSVARATGRPLVRVSLGGVRDESEVRGHRRTYVGAMPGRIVHALRKAEVKNPVMVLDEIDKLGRGWAGDPESALLEVLDPEQNHTFTDHYLGLPFDLSEVLFITTANDISTLSPPLRDRLEIIDVNGYTVDEKVDIGRDHLWPKKLEEHGLDQNAVHLHDDVIAAIVKDYTREAGVRQLSRELAKICRSLALVVARQSEQAPQSEQALAEPAERTETSVTRSDLHGILGKPKFWNELRERTQTPGVAAGLAYTPVGGDVLYVESTKMPGTGKIEITGQLGDVMNESARAALAFLRTHADEFGVDADFLRQHDLHIHVPAGGIPKDGPSAGVTIFTALASLLSGRRVRPDTAMTGEATLRGRVLPVGGIKTKVLAAHRAGFTRVVLPQHNERDLDEIPGRVLEQIEVVFASDMREVLDAALEPMAEPRLTGPRRCKRPCSDDQASDREPPLAA